MNKLTALITAAALGISALPAMAAGYGHQQTLTINGHNLRVADTSARILGNEEGSAPQLVADITDGLGKQKIPGYKIMVMSRAYSLAADARTAREGQGWSDNRYIHRGSKILIGIPVSGSQMNLADARLLNMAVISDADVPDTFKAEDKIRPRGKQLLKKETKVSQAKLSITALSLPDMASGEQSGGGVKLQAAAVLDGQTVQTAVNSTFTEFGVAKPQEARGFNADARFVR